MSVMKAIDADRDPGPLQVVRLYSKNGEHKLSLLPCSLNVNGDVDSWDLATPDGKVEYCGVDNSLVDALVAHLGWEDLMNDPAYQTKKVLCSACNQVIDKSGYCYCP